MRKSGQLLIFLSFIIGTICIIFYVLYFYEAARPTTIKEYVIWGAFLSVFFLSINEGRLWIKTGKRSEWGDLVFIAFLFLAVYLATSDILNSIIGAFSIYLLFGISEMKDYEVLNKILYITVITYNFIFFAGLLDAYLNRDGFIRDTAINISFWLMLALGFLFFGRKYIIVFRFMSPQYLTLGLYVIAWLFITMITQYTPYNLMGYIYEILIITNLIMYSFTGPLLDWMLGMKPTKNPELEEIIQEVAPKIGLDPKKIKIRFGQYPILNAMAYGAFWDMRMGIIAPQVDHFPKDELKGIVAHEMAHLKGKHTLSLTFITIADIAIRKILGWPVTTYDYTFAPESQPYSLFWFFVINTIIYIFLYVFVRMFEAQADLNTKRAGYGEELAKGLYNLESFYSYGREIGLNTMLLCDEKISEENRMLDYLSTGEYLYKMIVRPSKGALLSNLMNSHPPSYHRIIASLSEEEIPIAKEAIMPWSFLKRRNSYEFYLKTKKAQQKFLKIMKTKVEEEFHIDNLRELYKKLQYEREYSYIINKYAIILDLNTLTLNIGKIDTIEYQEIVGIPIFLKIEVYSEYNLINKDRPNIDFHSELWYNKRPIKTIKLNPIESKIQIFNPLEHYIFNKEGIFQLKGINWKEMNDKKKNRKKKNGKSENNDFLQKSLILKTISKELIFQLEKIKDFETLIEEYNEDSRQKQEKVKKELIEQHPENIKEKEVYKKPLPQSMESLHKFKDKTVFIKHHGTFEPYRLIDINSTPLIFQLEDLEFEFEFHDKKKNGINSDGNINGIEKVISLPLKDVVVYINKFFIPIHNEKQTLSFELKVLRYIHKNNLPCILYLKKAVNNEEQGYIQDIIFDNENQKNIKSIKFRNLFDVSLDIPYNSIDVCFIDEYTLAIQKKNEMSQFSLWMQKIYQKLKPNKVLF